MLVVNLLQGEKLCKFECAKVLYLPLKRTSALMVQLDGDGITYYVDARISI